MLRLRMLWIGAALLAQAALGHGFAADDTLWSRQVEPLLKERCAECHNPPKTKSGLDVSSLQTLLKGGDRGAAVVPGRAEDSHLYTFLRADADPHMPPKRQLTEEQIGWVKSWISHLSQARPDQVLPENTPPTTAASTRVPVWVPPPETPPARAIDHFIELGWQERNLTPTELAPDTTWVRRIYLDLLGRIPTAEEAATFLADPGPERRERLLDRLLVSPEHARHLREVFDGVWMGRRGAELEDQRARQGWFEFLERSFRRNRPWNELVRDLVVARPQDADARGAFWFLYERKNNAQAMAEAVAPLVFGVQIQCAQCHDHMVAREIKQAHYWGTVAAFNRSRNVDAESGLGVAESAIGGFVSFANLRKESQPAVLTFFNGRRIDEPWPKEGEKELDAPEKYRVAPPPEKQRPAAPAVPVFSRRAAFADAVTQDNPLLARAAVNRFWALLLGRGLVHPVDLMDSKHPPSHPDLLDWLAQDFAAHGYDVRRLIRTLVSTRAYQLDARSQSAVSSAVRSPATATSTPAGPEAFAWALEKPLSAEQLYQSLLVATGQQPDRQGRIAGREEAELRRAFTRQFPDLFAPEYNATLQQAMFLSNSPFFDALLEPRAGTLVARLNTMESAEERLQSAFLSVLGRSPDADERREGVAFLEQRAGVVGIKALVWALLTGAEFQLNH